MKSLLLATGRWEYEIVRPDGSVRSWGTIHNGIVNAALNDLLAVYFQSGTQKPSWFAGLIASGNVTLNSDDTIGTHAGWTESTAYSEATRRQWSPETVSGQTLQNSASMQFTMNAVTTLAGLFIVSNSTKGGTTGLLWSTGLFDTEQTMSVGETLRLYYVLQAASGG